MNEDEDEQDISEDESNDPKTVKRAAFNLDPEAKKKGRTKEVPTPGGATLVGKTTESSSKTDTNPNKTTTKTKVPKQ